MYSSQHYAPARSSPTSEPQLLRCFATIKSAGELSVQPVFTGQCEPSRTSSRCTSSARSACLRRQECSSSPPSTSSHIFLGYRLQITTSVSDKCSSSSGYLFAECRHIRCSDLQQCSQCCPSGCTWQLEQPLSYITSLGPLPIWYCCEQDPPTAHEWRASHNAFKRPVW